MKFKTGICFRSSLNSITTNWKEEKENLNNLCKRKTSNLWNNLRGKCCMVFEGRKVKKGMQEIQ